MKFRCQGCNTETTEKTAKTWRSEDFLTRNQSSKRYLMTLYLCPKCLPFVKHEFGEPRAWLAKQLPPDVTL